ncbi:efflux RND transporter periplasmic adaptor subunit [Bradyrhizobium sp. 157]|uniref:efflux RND transporter periplasmic adaptor subunit n=1 Tax=Bradyrhizobium sp. 157 TaxID=2782631 RepID=UPI001FF751E7|nr:efflux RND transporter periplasmic adaptor subunit [Bradyrhizobium sp. 157]MCK1641628.1 efflux RND transporter periplasmic adaptor subunit [Bradyrhizobium sp. 157]
MNVEFETLRRQPASLRKAAFVAALAVSSLTLPGLACAVDTDGPTVSRVTVTGDQMHQLDIAPATAKALVRTKSAIGQIAFNEDASTAVLSPFSGRVSKLLKKIGEDVKNGEPLFEIDSPEVAQAQTDFISALQALEKAKSQLNLAKRTLDRQLSLMSDKATAQRDVDQARNEHAAAESDFATAQGAVQAFRNRLRVIFGRDGQEIERIERERIINPLIPINAPIDGTVVNRKIGPGQFIRADAAEPLYSISDLSVMWLKAFVPESDIAYIRVGQELQVKVSAFPEQAFTARITSVGASSDQQTRRIVVRSEIDNPGRLLKADMFATFRIATGDPASLPVVPVASIIRNGDAASVWVECEPRVFERRKVLLGGETNGLVQIVSGLKPGERVVGRGAIFVDNEVK